MIAWLIAFMSRKGGGVGAWALIGAGLLCVALLVWALWLRGDLAKAESSRDTAVARLHEARTVFNATLALKQTSLNWCNATSTQKDKALDGLREQYRQAQAASARLAADRTAAARIMAQARPVCPNSTSPVVDDETSQRAIEYLSRN